MSIATTLRSKKSKAILAGTLLTAVTFGVSGTAAAGSYYSDWNHGKNYNRHYDNDCRDSYWKRYNGHWVKVWYNSCYDNHDNYKSYRHYDW